MFHDISVLISELSGDFLGHVSQLLSSCSYEVIGLVKESITQAGQSLEQLQPVILDIMIEAIVEKSVEVGQWEQPSLEMQKIAVC